MASRALRTIREVRAQEADVRQQASKVQARAPPCAALRARARAVREAQSYKTAVGDIC